MKNMHFKFLLSLPFLAGWTLLGADLSPKDAVTAAAKKLSEQPNYSWKTVVEVPESAQFRPGPTEGKTEKGGVTHVKMSFGNNDTEMVMKGGNAVLTTPDGDWQRASELENAEGPGRFLARMVRNFKAPAAQVSDFVADVKEWKLESGVYFGQMTEEGARRQFRFGQPQNPKGFVKVWIKEGLVQKVETKLEGKLEFNGNEIDASRTTTTEIKDVGTTKVDLPDAAKKKLSA